MPILRWNLGSYPSRSWGQGIDLDSRKGRSHPALPTRPGRLRRAARVVGTPFRKKGSWRSRLKSCAPSCVGAGERGVGRGTVEQRQMLGELAGGLSAGVEIAEEICHQQRE